MQIKVARLISDLPSARPADGVVSVRRQALYRCAPPLDGHEFVMASTSTAMGATETYLFPADAKGEVTDWLELSGSAKNCDDHAEAFAGAGYAMAADIPLA